MPAARKVRQVIYRAGAPPYVPQQGDAAHPEVPTVPSIEEAAVASQPLPPGSLGQLQRHVRRVVLGQPALLSRTGSVVVVPSGSGPLIRTVAGVAVPQLPRASSAVFAPTMRLLRASTALPVAQPVTLAEVGAEGLETEFRHERAIFLRLLGLEKYAAAADKWVDESGACVMSEVLENLNDLSTALRAVGMTAEEGSKLAGGARTAAYAARVQVTQRLRHSYPSALGMHPRLVTAASVPVTVREQKRASAALLLALVDEASIEEGEQEHGVQPEPAVEEPAVDSGDAANAQPAPATGAAGIVDAALDDDDARGMGVVDDKHRHRTLKKQDKRPRWFTPPRHRWRVDEKLLRARIPTEQELTAVTRAQEVARAAVLAEWGDEPEGQAAASSDEVRRRRRQAPDEGTFHGMRTAFLAKYKAAILSELQKFEPDIEIVPADVSMKVEQKFMAAVGESGEVPTFGYHGTRQANIPSILERGLLVPSDETGVRVANGAAHGIGIYTGLPGAAGLSRGFCDSDKMIICGVVDPKAEPVNLPEDPDEAGTPSGCTGQERPRQPFVGGHRQSRKHVPTAPAAALAQTGGLPFPHENRDEGHLKVCGAARIFFEDSYVAPLFVAKRPGTDLVPPASEARLNMLSAEQAGRGQVLIRQTGRTVWRPPEPSRGWNEIRVKRVLVRKERDAERNAARRVKVIARTTSANSQA